MLNLENLSEQTFEDILETLIKQIPRYATGWTNTQANDPGITMMELFAWLDTIMHQYMSRIPEESELALLSLFGKQPKAQQGAQSLLSVVHLPQDCILPPRSKWYSERLVFENTQPLYLCAGDIAGLSLFRAGQELYVTPEDIALSGGLSLFGETDTAGTLTGNAVSIFLTQPPAIGQPLQLYIQLQEQENRNAGQSRFPMSKLSWTYLGEDGIYHPILNMEGGESFEGLVTLTLPAPMGKDEHGYPLRATLVWEEFDICPSIASIHLNAFPVVQEDSFCDALSLTHEGTEPLRIFHQLATVDSLHLYEKETQDNTYRPVTDYSAQTGACSGEVFVTLPPHCGKDILAVVFAEEYKDKMCLGSTSQIGNQIVKFGIVHLKEDVFSLILRRPNGSYRTWYCDPACTQPYAFSYNATEKTLQFGDNLRSYAPFAVKDAIYLHCLRSTEGAEGNIKAGKIDRSSHDLSGNIIQVLPATGGCDKESIDTCKATVSRVFQENRRAVTEADYLHLIHSTPGLCIQHCKLLRDIALNRLSVVIQGAGRAKTQALSAYQNGILTQLEPHRLLGTQIEVIWAEPIPLSLSVELVTSPYYNDIKENIHLEIRAYIEALDIGSSLHYSELFGKIEHIPCIEQVISLDISTSAKGVVKTESNDFLIPARGMYQLEQLRMDTVTSHRL